MIKGINSILDSLRLKNIRRPIAKSVSESPFEQIDDILQQLTVQFNGQNNDPCLSINLERFDGSARSTSLPVQIALLGNFQRIFLVTSLWTLTVRYLRDVSIEIFLCQSAKLVEIDGMELIANCKLKLECDDKDRMWKCNSFAIDRGDIETIVKSIFRDFIRKSVQEAQSIPEHLRLPLNETGLSLNSAVQELIRAKHELSQRIVDEHERIYSAIARDIHDAVIGNILSIKHLLAPDPDSLARVEAVLDDVHLQLRSICNDLAPRDLQGCGLRLIMDDLVERFAETMNLDAVTDWCCTIPDLPLDVQLHVYRIVQECLNNVAKHSNAKQVWVRFHMSDSKLKVIVEDDGTRIPKADQTVQRRAYSGSGRGIMTERALLINRLFPTCIKIDAQGKKGFTVELSIDLSKDLADKASVS